MYRLVIPRSLFTQLALLDEGTEGLFTCEESARLRYVVKVRNKLFLATIGQMFVGVGN